MPELDGKKYSYDKKGMGQYKKDLAKKGYTPQMMRNMNAGYTPQTQMNREQLAQKAYGSRGIPQIEIVNQAIKKMKMQQAMMQMQQMKKMQENIAAEKAASVINNIVDENVNLKKQINLQNVQNKKSNMINKARRKPVDTTKKRTGK